ncbi:hypothetical protein Dda_6661 [Drechslerella dactyloides]|uniref:BTB domain-containing protein n=1 Tax=Drechslerella dactyloides TaxID=74499 RepID=A0AAD6ITY3_DREDA|nr:hypothetical protein Dda_6661 [Drechslerella dactyloides]
METQERSNISRNHFIRDPLHYDGFSATQDAQGQQPVGPQTKEDLLKLGDAVDKCTFFQLFEFEKEPQGGELKDFLLYNGLMLGVFSDVTLNISEQKEYHLHRFILAQSPAFREHFMTREFTPGEVVKINSLDDFTDLEAVEHVINRMYGNFGDKYYECKNLVGIMAFCIQLGMIDWFHGYLDRALARLCADNLLLMVRFAQDDFYGQYVEQQVFPIIKHYMVRYGNHLGLELWRYLPVDLVVDIMMHDGFIYAGSHVDDKRKELGFCKVIVGKEFDRWTFVRDMYFDRIGLDNESLRRARKERVLPPHITQDLIEEHRPLFDLLNSNFIQYCNMNPVQWKEVRRETFLGVSILIRPDIIADAVCQGVVLRRQVESASLEDRKLNLCYSPDHEMPDDILTYDVPKIDRFIHRPRRVEIDFDHVPKSSTSDSSSNHTDMKPFIDDLCTFPPIRFSVEFQFHRGIGAVSVNTPLRAEPVFYAGNWWQFWIQRTRDEDEPADRINMYIRRVGKPTSINDESTSRDSWATLSEVNYDDFTRQAMNGHFNEETMDMLLEAEDGLDFYNDNRPVIRAYYRVYAPAAIAGYDPEKFIMIENKESPKIKCPAVAKTTMYESKPTDFPLDCSIVVPGRLLVNEVEAAQEIREFVNDSAYFQGEVDRIMKGGPMELPKKNVSDLLAAYQHAGEVNNEWPDESGSTDTMVTRSLMERDVVWSNMKFAIVIGLV